MLTHPLSMLLGMSLFISTLQCEPPAILCLTTAGTKAVSGLHLIELGWEYPCPLSYLHPIGLLALWLLSVQCPLWYRARINVLFIKKRRWQNFAGILLRPPVTLVVPVTSFFCFTLCAVYPAIISFILRLSASWTRTACMFCICKAQ